MVSTMLANARRYLRADLEDGGDVVELGHCEGFQHSGISPRTLVQGGASERGDVREVQFGVQVPVTIDFLLQQHLAFEFPTPVAVAAAK